MEAMRQLALTNLRLTLEAYADGTLPEFELFARTATLVNIKRGDDIIAPGSTPPYLFVMLRGLAKFTVDVEGSMRTVEVFEEGDVVGTLNTVGSTTLAKSISRGVHPRTEEMLEVMRAETVYRFTVKALEECTALRVDYRVIDQLAYRHLEWSRMVSSLLTARLMHLHANLPDSQIGTPEGRLRRLTKRHPRLVARMSQREIANWIGVNEVSLSRIMKRMREEQRTAAGAATPARVAEPPQESAAY